MSKGKNDNDVKKNFVKNQKVKNKQCVQHTEHHNICLIHIG
ncbi:hypothetical protein SHAL103562_08725 [Shewanella algae]